MKALCTQCYQRVEFDVTEVRGVRTMTCCNCGAQYVEPAKQHKDDSKDHRREKEERAR